MGMEEKSKERWVIEAPGLGSLGSLGTVQSTSQNSPLRIEIGASIHLLLTPLIGSCHGSFNSLHFWAALACRLSRAGSEAKRGRAEPLA